MNKSVFSFVSLLKFFLILFVIPSTQTDLFLPFLKNLTFSADPWTSWIAMHGRVDSFPYGIVMILIFIPIRIFSGLSSATLNLGEYGIHIIYSIIILSFDLFISRILWKNNVKISLQYLYLLSPIIFWVNYILGQNDLIPAFFLLLSGLQIKNQNYLKAGVFLGLAIGSKFSLLLAIPFILVYLYDNPRFYKEGFRLLSSTAIVCLISYLPAAYSVGFRKMVFATPESMKIFDYSVSMGNQKFVIFPAIYLLLLYWIWRAGRTSRDVLLVFVGVALLVISISSPASLGWAAWGIPILCLLYRNASIESVITFYVFQLALLISRLNSKDGIVSLTISKEIVFNIPSQLENLTFTGAILIGGLFFMSTIRKLIESGDTYNISVKPLSISIAGDSGVGKDTLANGISRIFGKDLTVIISGDGYHKYERGDINWKKFTHLNPEANFLNSWANHVQSAISRRSYLAPQYDHIVGRFANNQKSKKADLVISQGLHAIYGRISELADLNIFIAMEEQLRTELKLERDTILRKQTVKSVSSSINNRKIDASKFIESQIDQANLMFFLSKDQDLGTIKVEYSCRDGEFINLLNKNLESVANATVVSRLEKNITWFRVIDEPGIESCFPQLTRLLIQDSDQVLRKNIVFDYGALAVMECITIIALAHFRRTNFGKK